MATKSKSTSALPTSKNMTTLIMSQPSPSSQMLNTMTSVKNYSAGTQTTSTSMMSAQ